MNRSLNTAKTGYNKKTFKTCEITGEMRDKVFHNYNSEVEKKITSILRILSESTEPLGSITIARELEQFGVFLSERAVRYHLRMTDERGFTQSLGREGRMITPKGMEELKVALAPEQVGFILEKLELLL